MKNFLRVSLIVLSVLCAAALFAVEAAPAEDAGLPEQDRQQADVLQDIMPARTQYTKTELYILQGDKFFNAGNFTNAVKYYYAVAKLEPKNLKAWKKTAFCYYQMKQHKYAYFCFQKVLAIDKADKDAVEFMDYYKTIVGQSKKTAVKREMADSLWRASVLPGFGQFYNNQYSKGIVIAGSFICSLGLTIFSVADEKMKYEKYLKANENQDLAFKEAQDAYTNALIWGLIAGGVYAIGIVDAALNYNCEEARSIGMEVKNNAVYLAAGMKW